MTTQIIDLSQIDLTGGLRLNGGAFRAAHINGERLWPFGVDLLYTGGIGGASYLPDAADVYGASNLAAFGEGVSTFLDEKAGTPVLGPELVVNGSFADGLTGWTARNSALLSVVDGRLRVENGAASAGGAFQQIATVPGRFYVVLLDFTYVDRLAGIAFGTTQGGNQLGVLDASQSAPLTGIFRATGTATFLTARINSSTLGASALFDNISVREIVGFHALQPSASLRPLLGRAPKAGRRNQLTWTQDLDNPAWVKSAATVIPNAAIAPDGTLTADALIADASNAVHKASLSFPYVATTGVGSLYVKSAGARYFGIGTASTSPARYAFFDFENMNAFTRAANSAQDFPDVDVIDEGDGWYRIVFVGPYLGGASTNILRLYVLGAMPAIVGGFPEGNLAYAGDGVSGVYFWGHQIDLNALTDYQRIGAATDVTEAGVPSYPFIRFDLSDDRLDTVLPNAVTGDVVIAGRNGSVIAPHSYAANTTFQLGPTAYTGGTPGILRAIGDVVGWSILGKTLTPAERERLMRFYKRRGAKGLLVPGPELLVNGTFDANLNGWSTVSGTITSWENGRARITSSGQERQGIFQDVSVTAGRVYLLSVGYLEAFLSTGATDTFGRARVLSGWNTAQVDGVGPIGGSGSGVFRAITSGTARISFGTANSGSWAPAGNYAIADNISVRELRPEEGW